MTAYPAYRIRITSLDGRTHDVVSHGKRPVRLGTLPVTILAAGQSCIRNGKFCAGCDRCDKGLR